MTCAISFHSWPSLSLSLSLSLLSCFLATRTLQFLQAAFPLPPIQPPATHPAPCHPLPHTCRSLSLSLTIWERESVCVCSQLTANKSFALCCVFPPTSGVARNKNKSKTKKQKKNINKMHIYIYIFCNFLQQKFFV